MALLPFASLTATTNPRQLLTRTAQQVSTIESVQQRREVGAYAQLLAGLRFEKTLIRQLFRESTMQESVIYQDILQEGKQAEALALVLRQLNRRLKAVMPNEIQSQVKTLSLSQLEDLGEALLDFSSIDDLLQWLETR
ncbi:MAG: DUF4351 domain-containing protein [Leptolyngbyaceae cyanobacterium bins.59]|nr:DUF4351 domain-containing protein [Leptolyngbyaceae cyanobacterium bins.59]